MTADRINRIFEHAAGRLDDDNDALILNIDATNRKAEIIDEVVYERDGTVKVWGHLSWRIQGRSLKLLASSIAGGGIYKGEVSLLREQNVEDLLMDELGNILANIQRDYVDEGP